MHPTPPEPHPDPQPEYDFSGGTRGRHHEAYGEGTHLVALDQDVADVFKDSEAVNEALRMLIKVARTQAGDAKPA